MNALVGGEHEEQAPPRAADLASGVFAALVEATTSVARAGVEACLHCGATLGDSERARGAAYCCTGCEAVHGLLQAEGLGRYYDLGGGQGSAVTTWGKVRDRKWLERLRATQGPPSTTAIRSCSFDVQGIHCAACVWLFEELFRREAGAITLTVNPALGRMDLSVAPDFAIERYIENVERFGYLVGPSLKEESHKAGELLLRTGVSIAIAMNAMIFAIAIYAGLDSGPIHRFFHALNFGLATLSVVVGGTVFFRSAWQALRQRVLHLDVPIALGIILAYAGSAYSLFARAGQAAYFDTVSVFIALMLVGRFLQERVLERNRRQLLSSDGVDGLLTRVVRRDGVAELVACGALVEGDRLLVAPSDLVPVPAILESEAASVSLDWINGESTPREVERGQLVPAGAFNVGQGAITMVATSDFESSPIVALLRTTRARESDAARATPWWRLFTRIYVSVVLLAALGALVTWWLMTRDLARALEVTTAVLVVTCPCAFGIATPMAYELTQAGLRRAGVFVRSASFLDRAVDVNRVVFDKTGTLTTGALHVADEGALFGLAAEERHVLYNLAARSTHPKSTAIARAKAMKGERFAEGLAVVERAGAGLELAVAGSTYRLGSTAFAGSPSGSASNDDVVFSKDGDVLAAVTFRESLRSDASAEVRTLDRDGYDVWILSGDGQRRVDALADTIGVPRDHAVGDRSPEGKAAWLADHDQDDTMMVGDGLNDGLATERAFTSATPAVDRPFMPARTDLYFTSAGLRPIRLALTAARALRRTTHRNLVVAIVYNVVTVGLAYAGLMTPLLCAVVMPASSLSIVLATLASLSSRSALWKS